MPNLTLLLGGAVAVLVLIIGAYFYGVSKGDDKCEARHANAVIETNTENRKTDVKIRKKIPVDINKPAAIELLRTHVR